MRSAALFRLALVGALGTVLAGCPAPQKAPPPPVVENNTPPPPRDPPPADDPPPPVDKPPVDNGDGSLDVVGQFAQITDKMCACADQPCAESVNEQFDEWLRANESAKGSKSEQERAKKIAERYTRCMMAAMTGKAPAPPTAPAQTEKCGEGDACADGLTCIKYYGIAGKRGPEFKSCEIPCGKGKPACPDAQRCAIIADGPGQVCRATR